MIRSVLIGTMLLLLSIGALVTPILAEDEGRLILSEVMYDPVGEEVEGEWIELLVVEGQMDMAGWTLTDLDGHLFTLPSLVLPDQTYVVVRVGTGLDELDMSDGRITLFMNSSQGILNNNGDELLLDSGGTAYDFLAYGPGSLVDYPPFQVEWDGRNLSARTGQTLSVFPNGNSEDKPEDWISLPPTPGRSNGFIQQGENEIAFIEVYYNNHRDNEYICIANTGTNDVNLTGWVITDHETEISFPSVTYLEARSELCLTQNSTSYYEDLLIEADFTYSKGNATRAWTYGGQLDLRNDGDEVTLLTQYGREIDSFAWGASDTAGLGWHGDPTDVVRKGASSKRRLTDGTFVDTNSSGDWESLKDFGIGLSSFTQVTSNVEGPVIAFHSPGTSLDVVLEVFRNARESILLNAYQLTNRAIGEELANAADRGVRLRILLEGQPVSGIPEGELALVENLHSRGADVRVLLESSDNEIFKRYSYNHAKYAVVDRKHLVLSSENWGESGYPVDGKGNRGWGVVVSDSRLAEHFASVFTEDWNPQRRDTFSFEDAQGLFQVYEGPEDRWGHNVSISSEMRIPGNVEATAVVGPDNLLVNDAVLGMIDSASDRIMVQQFYIRKTWRVGDSDFINPLLEGLVRAAERGCGIMVLLDSTWYNTMEEDSNDNDDTVDFLNTIAHSRNLNISAKLMGLDEHGIVKLHNKGMVVDGNRVLVSSLNWNYNSFSRNREAGLILSHDQIGAYFERIFLHDWKDDIAAPVARISGIGNTHVGEPVVLSGLDSDDNQGIARYSWDIDSDGTVDSNDAIITVSYDTEGLYTVRLEVEDAWGNSNETSVQIVVTNRVQQVSLAFEIVLAAVVSGSLILLIYHIRKRRTKDI